MALPPLPRGFRLVEDENEEDHGLPPLPSGYSDAPEPVLQAPRPARTPAVPSLDDLGSITGARDGDTFTTSSGTSVRGYGFDAPELKQQGWDRQGQAVPIGADSQRALGDMLARARSAIGGVQGQSYGRAVAPVSIGGRDAGLSMIRDGNALAAPEYLKADQARSFDYMQAERLARLNGLGLHDTFAQTPSDFRHNPQPSPDRETVARFWDTPTPFAGIRPEAENRVLEMTRDPNVPIADIAEFAKANGAVLDPASAQAARDHFLKYGNDGGVAYRDSLRVLTDQGDGAVGAAGRGFGSGALAGGLDEVGALADTLGLTDGRENLWNSERRFADIWSNNQAQNSAILGFDEQQHPYAELGGELAGGLVAPFGAGARTLPELARVGAAYGAASGFLGTDGDLGERSIAGAVGVPIGGVLGAGAGKALELGAPLVGRALGRFAGRAGDNAGVLADDAARFVDGAEPPLPAGYRPVDSAEPNAPTFRPVDEADMPPLPDGYRPVDANGLDNQPVDGGNLPRLPEGYRMAPMGMDAEPAPSILQDVPRQPDYLFPDRPTPMDQPLTEAQRRAMAARIDPRDLAPIPSNEIGSVEELAARDAGRFAPATAPNERGELTRQTVRSYNGAEVPKVGPIDMVGWLRLNGGLQDQSGELSHMGLNNAARRGMDFVGQEARFGPLVNEQGMRLDDAAHAAWEAGYFPDHMERPSVNEFLDALRSTHEGRARNFLPEDLPEVDRYYGAQQERYALEQQRFESSEPILRDKSLPADEPQPFAPPEAYEEWGVGGGPDFAGNIRLEKLQTPQDISRALSTIERRVGFDAATRGRVSQAETERLAAELNMTPDALIARRQGQAFNAEEALAARQILAKSSNELVNAAKRIKALDDPGDEMLADFQLKLSRHVAIQEQVSGMTAEAGRALQQFRQAADSRAVRKDVLASVVMAGGGKKSLRNAADAILEASESEPGKFNTVADKLTKPKWRDYAIELMYISKLSSPATHVVNAVSNTLTALAQPAEFAAASAIGKARQAFSGTDVDRVIGSEIGARAFGMLQGVKEGLPAAVKAFRTGETFDGVLRVEKQFENALPGRFGHHARTPLRALTAADEFFKAIARRMDINGQAVRIAHKEGLRGEAATARIAELSLNPTDEMLTRAMDYSRYITFQTPLGDFGRGIQQAKQGNIAATAVVPFVRTPTNLFKFAAERSPAALLMKGWWDDIRAGGAQRDVAIAKAVVGSGVGAAVYEAALKGFFTGSPPMDDKKAQFMRANGWQPYSFKLGDKYYSFSRMDPFATTLGVAADMATKAEGMSERQLDNYATLLTASVIKNMTNKVYLSGVSDLVEAVNDWERFGPSYLRNFVAGNVVPAASGAIERSIDPTASDVRSVGDAIKARIPGLSSSLPPRRDIWGKPIVSEGGLGPDVMSPAWVSTNRHDPVSAEMLAIGARFEDPDRRPTIDGKKVDLTPQQYNRYAELAGRNTRSGIEALMAQPGWAGLPTAARAKQVSDAARAGKADARAELFGAPPRKRAKSGLLGSSSRANSQDVPALPAGYSPAPEPGEAMGVNVYRDIQQAIPGVRITSGFRTPEYQADMRRRGYHPAQNSAHLDGSALDLLPPPGKSMSWLRDRVRAFSKDAKLLNEGDHLHAIFPGYYGAPVLGGARGAGLKNPYEGMPPLPSGYKLVE